ncbi:MAG: ion transporter [Eubacteriales bacterium]|nr:ion transporter [Eubacteriales bacterium]
MNKRTKFRNRIFNIIEIGNETDIPSRVFDYFIVVVIITNITDLVLETFQSLSAYMTVFNAIEVVTTIVFIVEYILRVWTAEFLYPGIPRWKASLRFICSVDGLIILLSILPFFFLQGFVVFRMLRVARIFHLFRINKQFDSFTVIRTVLVEKRNQLVSSLFIIVVLMFASSICMYSAEHQVQPEVFRNAFSGLWWSVSALLTVGYGDIYPITPLGQTMAIIISFLGVGAVAIPTGIISAGFVEQYQKAQDSSGGQIMNLQTLVIDIDSKWIGQSVSEIREGDHIIIVLVDHEGAPFIPEPDYHVRYGDQLAIYRESEG